MMSDEAAFAEETGTQTPDAGTADGQGGASAESQQSLQTQAMEAPAEGGEQTPPADAGPVERKVYDNVRIALKQEREAAKTLQKELADHREWRARLDERQKFIKEASDRAEAEAKRQKEAAERPDPAVDPVGADLYDTKRQLAQLTQNYQTLAQQMQQGNQAMQANFDDQRRTQYVTADVQRFAQTTAPDYQQAANYAAQQRMAFWQGLGRTPEDALKIVKAESDVIINDCMTSGKSVAEVVYGLARQWGYQAPQPQNGNGNGAQMQVRQPTANQAAQQRLQQVAAGQRVQGLNGVPASGGENGRYANYSQADLANMTEREWQAVKSDPARARELAIALAKADGVEVEDAMSVLRAQ